MVDYAEWLRRAERFVRGTNALPGEWFMRIAVEPPLASAAADSLAKTLPLGLPPPIRDFYLTASASAHCRYSWTPVGKEISKVEKVFANRGVYGGARICPATELAEHREDLLSWENSFLESGGFGPAAAQILRECVPLIPVGNGDYVVLHSKAGAGAPMVAYVSHDADAGATSPIIPLARDMDDFLLTWEKLGYVGPEIWLLGSFLNDSPTGLLDADCKLARKWRALMTTAGFPASD